MKNLSKVLGLLAFMMLVGCGDEKKDEERVTIGEEGSLKQMEVSTDEDTATEEGIETNSEENDVVQLSISGDDQMKFNKNELKVKAGQTVKLTLKHTGQMSKEVMGHNFVLLKKGTNLSEFAQKATQAKSNDYIPEGTGQVIAHTKIIGGGEETTITFEAPEAGTYDFICSFPGHWVQMQGKFIVE